MVTSIMSDSVIKQGEDISKKYTISIIIIFICLSLFGFSCIFLKKQKTKPNKTKHRRIQKMVKNKKKIKKRINKLFIYTYIKYIYISNRYIYIIDIKYTCIKLKI